MEAMNDPYSAAADFARIIEEDVGLTTRVLKLVNSSMYAVSPKVDSVSRAIAILGVEPVQELVLATSAVSAFDNMKSDLVNLESFWMHSLGAAVVSRVIGTNIGNPNPETLFVCGLLHDVGRLIMSLADPACARRAHARAVQSSMALRESEREEFGYDHALVGSALLQRWELPSTLSEPVRFHHQPSDAGAFETEAAVVHVADIIAHAMLFGTSGEHAMPSLSEAAWTAVDGTTWFCRRMLSDVELQFQTAVQGLLS